MARPAPVGLHVWHEQPSFFAGPPAKQPLTATRDSQRTGQSVNPCCHAEVLRDTMRQVEQTANMSPDHPDMRELKRIMLEKIRDIELGNTRDSGLSSSLDPSNPLRD